MCAWANADIIIIAPVTQIMPAFMTRPRMVANIISCHARRARHVLRRVINARVGHESRHNLSYWRYDDYIGIGPGAHGRRLKCATQRHKKPENFLSAIDRNAHGISSEDHLDPASRATESLLMGLRLSEGISLERLSSRTGIAPDKMLDFTAVDKIARLGLITRNGDRITVTPQGMPLLDAILPQIVAVEADAAA